MGLGLEPLMRAQIFEPLVDHEHGESMDTIGEITRPTAPVPTETSLMEDWILETLRREGMQTLDQLGLFMSADKWARFFLAIDRLSRSGRITLSCSGRGEYLVKAVGRSGLVSRQRPNCPADRLQRTMGKGAGTGRGVARIEHPLLAGDQARKIAAPGCSAVPTLWVP